MRCFTLINGNICTTDEEILFDYAVDVLVAGLGTAGYIAAIYAAEKGLSVIGVERLSGMGGTGTYGCVWDYYYGSPGGRFEGINNECRKMIAAGYAESDYTHEGKSIPGAVKSYILEKNALNAGCCLWYETVVTGIYLDENKVVGVRCFKNGKMLSVKAKVVIDSTGEAALCRMAGCKMLSGRKWDGLKQQFSKTIGVLNNNLIRGIWKHCGRLDKTDARSISDAIIKAGSEVPCLKNIYLEKDRVIFEGTVLGVRESSRIEPEELLSFEDYVKGKVTDKPLFYAFSPLDNINRDIAFESEVHQDWHLMATMYNYGISVGVPMGTLLPKGIKGIIVAGKGIGVDHDFSTCIRMKKDLEKCGEAAAAIAYLAIKNEVDIKDVPYEQLKLLLEASGCLDKRNDVGICDLRYKEENKFEEGESLANSNCFTNSNDELDKFKGKSYWRKVRLMTEPDEIRIGLSTEDNSIAMWSVRQLGAEIMLPYLRMWMKDSNATLAKNSAIAAGMLGDREACVPLRRIISELPYIPEDHIRPQYYPDYTRAICLLGRLHDSESTETLLKLIENRASDAVQGLKTDTFYPSHEDFAFQFISMSLMSLIKISEAHPEKRDLIANRLKKWASDSSFTITISMGNCEMSEILRNIVHRKFGF